MASGVGSMRMTHTGVSNSVGRKPGMQKQTIMLEPGHYKTRTAALNVSYNGFDDSLEVEHALKVKVTLPEKWLDQPTPVSKLKAYFMKAYRKKYPEARLSKLEDAEVELAIKDESMFVFSKKAVDDAAIVSESFYDRQDVWAMGPADWAEMATELKKYRRMIVRSLAHCHRSTTDACDQIVPVTTTRQLSASSSYVVFTGWYKMQCVIVTPHMTIADLKQYLHEKNGARMPLECIDIGVRSGDDIRIIDDALTLEQVYVRAMTPGEPDFGSGPGTFNDEDAKAEEDGRRQEAAGGSSAGGTTAADKSQPAGGEGELSEAEMQRAAEEIERNRDRRGLGAADGTYFRRHDTTSRVHADWDNESATYKTYSNDDAPHASGIEFDQAQIGPQKPMHLRTTHKPAPSKYERLTADGETTARITSTGEYEETPVLKTADIERAQAEARAQAAAQAMQTVTIEDVPEDEVGGSRVVDLSEGEAGQCEETLAGLEREDGSTAAAAAAAAKLGSALSVSPFVGKTLVLGVGKRIQDEKHRIWVASVHDPYSFRGPEDRAAGGGQKDALGLQQNGAPKGWSAPAEGQATVNSDSNCAIM